MATTANPEPEPGSSPFPSQSENLGEKKVHKRATKLQREQYELLQKHDSWAQVLERRAQRMVNVPPEVLEGLKEQYVRSRLPDTNRDTLQASGVKTGNGVLKDCGNESEQDGEEEESAGEDIPWSLSPQRSPRHPEKAKQVSSGRSDQGFVSQLPARSPLRATFDASNIQRRPAFNDFPSSSFGPEEELEVVAPAAYTKDISNVDMVNKMPPLTSGEDATPPSAQVQIPSTFEPNSSVSAPQPPNQPDFPKQRPMAGLNMELLRAPAKNVVKASMSATTRKAHDLAPTPTSSSAFRGPYASSSIIPSTDLADSDQSPVKHSIVPLSVKSPIKETPRRDQTLAGTRLSFRTSSPHLEHDETVANIRQSVQPSSPDIKPESPQVRHSCPASVAEREPVVAPEAEASSESESEAAPETEPKTPFAQYSEAYPQFGGTLGHFVNVCVYIYDKLQQRQALANYQYDDFIRAWHEGFVPYICNGGTPLSADKWYMDNVDELSYTNKIVTKQNLESILVCYPEEVKRARKRMEKRHKTSSATPQLENQELTAKWGPSGNQQAASVIVDSYKSNSINNSRCVSHEVSQNGLDDPFIGTDISMSYDPDEENDETTGLVPQKITEASVQIKNEMREHLDLPAPPLREISNKSTHVTTNKQESDTKGSMSFPCTSSGSFSRKRAAADTLRTAATKHSKRVFTGSFIGSDAGSSTSFKSDSSRNSTKLSASGAAINPQTRDEKWKAFLAKRKRARESIASSGPVNSTPASGQE